jgi:hypothetical protein
MWFTRGRYAERGRGTLQCAKGTIYFFNFFVMVSTAFHSECYQMHKGQKQLGGKIDRLK